jgi:DNA polymerase-3 subunit gamma/tau
MTQALYLKWRPLTWSEIVGQEHIVTTLHNAVSGGRFSHAFLFAGPRGTGKTSTARILAKSVNCLEEDLTKRPCNRCDHCNAVNQGRFLDLIEIDAASNTSVDDVRDLRDKINFSPNQGRYKVYIIDEVHMLSTAAFNALLKTLEEPPAHAVFILATTEAHKIPATVLSRCQRHEFRRIPVNEIYHQLELITHQEGLETESEALNLIARQATGSLRDAISLLDQLASASQSINLDFAHNVLGTATSQSVLDIFDAILESEPAVGLDHIHRTLDSGSDPRQFARQIVDYLRNLLLVCLSNVDQVDVSDDIKDQMARHSQMMDVGELLQVLRAFNRAANDARSSWQPALPLEMAFIESLKAYSRSDTEREQGEKSKSNSVIPEEREPSKKKNNSSSPQQSEVSAGVSQSEPETDPLPKDISKNWRRILSHVRDTNPQTQALLNSCKPLGIKDGALILGFNGTFAKSKMEQGDNIEITKQALADVVGKELPIRCVISSADQSSIPADVEQDGLVATAVRDLGGKIVDVQ